MPVRSISDYIDASSRLRPFVTKARRIAGLDQVLLKTAPRSLTQACRVKEVCGGTLVLLAENAAVASKLKQLAPRLLLAYQTHPNQGEKITGIRIEVQVESPSGLSGSPSALRQLSTDSIENLKQLISRIEDSPLKEALSRLAARHKS
jgi:hypothetical protein